MFNLMSIPIDPKPRLYVDRTTAYRLKGAHSTEIACLFVFLLAKVVVLYQKSKGFEENFSNPLLFNIQRCLLIQLNSERHGLASRRLSPYPERLFITCLGCLKG